MDYMLLDFVNYPSNCNKAKNYKQLQRDRDTQLFPEPLIKPLEVPQAFKGSPHFHMRIFFSFLFFLRIFFPCNCSAGC